MFFLWKQKSFQDSVASIPDQVPEDPYPHRVPFEIIVLAQAFKGTNLDFKSPFPRFIFFFFVLWPGYFNQDHLSEHWIRTVYLTTSGHQWIHALVWVAVVVTKLYGKKKMILGENDFFHFIVSNTPSREMNKEIQKKNCR